MIASDKETIMQATDPTPAATENQAPVPLHGETLLDLAAARRLPRFAALRGGRGIPMPTLHRYTGKGFHGHVLETAKVGNRKVTSAEALDRFVAAVTAGRAAPPTPSQRSAAQKKAAAKFQSQTRRRRQPA
jgi:hypothetical protein